ncbi:MAG: ATP-binding cassette domain-containing protein [Candidatus Sericytochromatia bacterium]|nr:ATP-binding cassette domain-containing protein [Candidatus Sericytochromatia bacterium]
MHPVPAPPVGEEARPLLAAQHLEIGHGGRALVPAISLVVHPSDSWVVVGRNGAGKSTLLRTLLGLLSPVAGRVTRAPGATVVYVPQRVELEPTVPMRGVDVVAMGLDAGWSFLRPWRRRGDRDAVAAAIADVGAEAFAHQRFETLSVGQQQRLMLAQALVGQPALIILDEPTAAMDLIAERDTLAVLARVRAARGCATMLVTHRLSAGLRQAQHVVFLDAESQTAVVGVPATLLAHPVFQQHFGGVPLGTAPLQEATRGG